MRVEYIVIGFILMLVVLAVILSMLGMLPDVPKAIIEMVKGR